MKGGMRRLAALSAVAAASFTAVSHAANTAVPSPDLDLSGLGRVAIAGDFDAIALYSYQGQTASSLISNGSQSLLTRLPDGSFQNIGAADAYISAMCPFVKKDGSLVGVVVAGNFTSLGGVEASGIALWDPKTLVISPLPGIDGRVNSLLCDSSSGTVYVGGSFSGANSTNAIAWVSGWTNLPFSGFNGPVNAITKAPNGNIVFAGDFSGLGNASTPKVANDQIVNIASANIAADGSSTQDGFSDPKSIVCKNGAGGAGNTWLLANNRPGSYRAQFGFGFTPTLLRLYNTNQDGRGTKTFRYTNPADNGIMNFTYVDTTGQNRSCAASCPLPQGDTTAQDFHFVNNVNMNAFRLDIYEWYGQGGGLSGIELFQDNIFAYAVPEFNEPTCNIPDVIGATATSTGGWHTSPSGQSRSEYLTIAMENGASTADMNTLPSVVFKPDIRQSGNYSVSIYTPGCLGDNTCSRRGVVEVTGTMTSEGETIQTSLYQTNNYDKYDQIYFGYVDLAKDSFRPTVTLTPQAAQDGPLVVVAQRVGFELISSNGGLNGLFEYDPNEATINTDFASSAINSAGLGLDSDAQISSLAVIDDTLYAAGNFSAESSSAINNILSVGPKNATALPNSGLNNAVMTLYRNGSTLYVGGNFTSTGDNKVQGLNGVAAFSKTSNSWTSLGAGVDGRVFSIVPLQVNISDAETLNAIAITGYFTRVNAVGEKPSFSVDGFAIWVPSRNNWLHNLDVPDAVRYDGQLITETDVPGYNPLYAGSLTSQDLGNADLMGLAGSKQLMLTSYGLQLSSNDSSSNDTSMTKRDTTSSSTEDINGVAAALFYKDNGMNLTILGGKFSAPVKTGSARNFLIVNNTDDTQQLSGLPDSIDTSSVFLAMDTQGTTLFAGGRVTGKVNNNNINGLIVYDLQTAGIASTQPPALSGDNVSVNAIATQPDAAKVYVGGSFSKAGSLNCESICFYDTNSAQWNSPGMGISGVVETMTWASSTKLILAGDLTVGGNKTTIVTYDSKKQVFSTFAGAENLPGPVTALGPTSSSYNEYWAAGIASNNQSVFLQKYDGSKWTAVDGLRPSSVIRSLQVMGVTKNHDSTDLVNDDQILVVSGALVLPGTGNVSAALYNGTTFQPFILTASSSGGAGSISRMFVENPGALLSSSSKSGLR